MAAGLRCHFVIVHVHCLLNWLFSSLSLCLLTFLQDFDHLRYVCPFVHVSVSDTVFRYCPGLTLNSQAFQRFTCSLSMWAYLHLVVMQPCSHLSLSMSMFVSVLCHCLPESKILATLAQ